MNDTASTLPPPQRSGWQASSGLPAPGGAAAAACDPATARARARPRLRPPLGAWLVMMLALQGSNSLAQTPALTIETCTHAAQSCVGDAEQADAWLPPGASAASLLATVQTLRQARGLPPQTPVRLSCSSGQPAAALVQALQAAGLAAPQTVTTWAGSRAPLR